MKSISLFFLLCVSLWGYSQHNVNHNPDAHGSLSKSVSAYITNCENGVIPASGMIEANNEPTAILYEFKLNNVTASTSLMLSSTTNSIALAAFWSIITYNSSYKVRVRIKYLDGEDDIYTEWSDPCEFSLGKPPKYFQIEGIECNTAISLDHPIFCTQFYNATCYTFYVTNVTTGQSTTTGCTSNNYFVPSSLGISVSPGDVLSIYVSYTIGEEEIKVTRACEYRIENSRSYCHVIQENVDPYPGLGGTRLLTGTVGSLFDYYFITNADNIYYAPALWDAHILLIEQVIQAVLTDLDALLIPNVTTADCSNINQRMRISISPYPQTWVDDNLYENALGVASQSYSSQFDINYLGQNCVNIPNVQLYNIHGAYGDPSTLAIGNVYLNPAVSNFNFAYTSTSFPGYYDLYTVLLHEITHILGISRLDYIFQDKLFANTQELYNQGVFNCGSHTDWSLNNNLTCSHPTFFDGSSADYPIYAPGVFEDGSSLSHFPNDCGTAGMDFVMYPELTPGDYNRCYEQVEVETLQDLGYNLNTSMNGCTYTVNNTPYVIGNHDGLSVQADPDEGYLCDSHVYTPLSTCAQTNFVIRPLLNDVNADIIEEAVVKTGNTNSTVNIITSGTELEFYANIPGIYTIGYIPANSVTGRKGLPTYIQVWVPVCSGTDLDAVTCHDAPECNQICFNSIDDHTLLRGTTQTEPTGFAPGTNGFSIGCHISESDQTSGYIDSYSSVFFFVDTDLGEEYAVSFDRSYQILGPTSYTDPDCEFYAYLVKSSDMIGLANQSHNNFSSLPTDNQLIYKDEFTNGNEPFAPVALCFTADDEYDMILFYSRHVNNQHYSKRGKVTINNLEFMQKEFEQDVLTINECIPYNLDLGLVFCATGNTEFEWYESGTNTVVSTNQLYSAGTISTPLDDDYVFTMSYPSLPSTTLIPVENGSCTETYTVEVEIDDCCPPGSTVFHPLTCNSTSRTFGEDVDAVSNGNYYYCGAFSLDIDFGGTNLTASSPTEPEGWIAKFSHNCTEWLVERENLVDTKIEVTDTEEIFWCSRGSVYVEDQFQKIDPSSGSPLGLSWTVQPGSRISDFKINETGNVLAITGYAASGENYLGNAISPGVFILVIDFSGTFLGTVSYATSETNTRSFVAFNETSTDLYLVYENSPSQFIEIQIPYTSLISAPTLVGTFPYSGTMHFTELDYDEVNNHLYGQILYNANVGGLTGALSAGGASKTAIIETTTSFVSSSVFDVLWGGLVSQPQNFGAGADRPEFDIVGGKIDLSYVNPLTEIIVSRYTLPGSFTMPDWTTTTFHIPSPALSRTKGIKNTPLGTYTTGAFVGQLDVCSSGTLINSNIPTSFYGIKLDNTGGVAAMTIPMDNTFTPIDQSGGNTTTVNTAGTNAPAEQSTIKIYPNPGKDVFTLESKGDHVVTIMNSNGQQIIKFTGAHVSKFDLSEFATGLYMVKIETENEVQIIRLVKE